MRDVSFPLLALALAAALQGCGTSGDASFSSDLDAYRPPGGVVNPTKPTGPIVITQATAPHPQIPTHRKSTQRMLAQKKPVTQGPVYGADYTPPVVQDTTSTFDNLQFLNPALKAKITVVRVGSDRTESNLLSVFAGVRNKSSHPLDIEVQTLYKDKSGTPLTDGKGGWIPMTLKPHQVTQYRSMAISEDATDYVVRIRHADDSAQAGP